jgi:hypothetical protein
MIDFVYIEAAIFVLFGGVMFSFALDNLIPFFGFAKISIRSALIMMASVGSLFWSTWLFPMGVLLLLIGRPIFVVAILTVLYFIFMVAALTTTYLIGKRKGAE